MSIKFTFSVRPTEGTSSHSIFTPVSSSSFFTIGSSPISTVCKGSRFLAILNTGALSGSMTTGRLPGVKSNTDDISAPAPPEAPPPWFPPDWLPPLWLPPPPPSKALVPPPHPASAVTAITVDNISANTCFFFITCVPPYYDLNFNNNFSSFHGSHSDSFNKIFLKEGVDAEQRNRRNHNNAVFHLLCHLLPHGCVQCVRAHGCRLV